MPEMLLWIHRQVITVGLFVCLLMEHNKEWHLINISGVWLGLNKQHFFSKSCLRIGRSGVPKIMSYRWDIQLMWHLGKSIKLPHWSGIVLSKRNKDIILKNSQLRSDSEQTVKKNQYYIKSLIIAFLFIVEKVIFYTQY